ncbi:MAG: ribonuclease, partial [Clostridia bacterium]|nr:ribonuclease [Clostridia bacterium]
MRTFLSRMLALMLVLALLPVGFAWGASAIIEVKMDDYVISENASYTSLAEVALYIAAYGRLPSNFLAKKDAEALG